MSIINRKEWYNRGKVFERCYFMKNLIVFYSFEGSTAFVAEELQKLLQAKGEEADIYEIKVKKNPPKSGFGKFAAGGFNALTQRDPGIDPVTVDVNSYDRLYIGTPIWASNPPGAIKAFIKQAKPIGKDCILIACSGGGNSGKTFEKIGKYLAGNQVLKTLDLASAKHHPEETKTKLEELVQ